MCVSYEDSVGDCHVHGVLAFCLAYGLYGRLLDVLISMCDDQVGPVASWLLSLISSDPASVRSRLVCGDLCP